METRFGYFQSKGFGNCLLISVLTLFSSFFYNSSFGQARIKGPVIVCPAETIPNELIIPRKEYSKARINSTPGSKIEVDYVGFSPEAQVAFQYAVDIWESILTSDVPIRVRATWESLDAGVLGSAGASTLYRDFPNAPVAKTWYPVALAEKIAGVELNGEDEYDIEASFNSNFSNWYLGTDGQGTGQYDLVSVVLHELGHGLGFISGEDYDDTNNTARWDLQATGFPMIFTSFLEDDEGLNILELENGSADLGTFLTGEVFVSSDLVNIANEGPAEVFAPNPYDFGSSISHWDESTYNNTENALMTPAVAPSEVIHDPGILTLGFFADMGWFATTINHSPVLIADNTIPLKFKVTIHSDTVLIADDFVVNVFYGEGDTVSYQMIEKSAGVYEALVTPDQNEGILSYFFDGLSDGLNKSYRIPEIGSYETILTRLVTYTPPFLSSQGGDFENETLTFISSSNISGTGLWEKGVVTDKFDDYSSTAWVTSLTNGIEKSRKLRESALITPLFDLRDESKDYVLSFDYMSDFSDYDYAAVYYSLDSGITWKSVGHAYDDLGENWYGSNDYGDFFIGNTKDDEDVYQVLTATYPLFNLTGKIVMFKFSHFLRPEGAESEYGNDGFLIDNFQVLSNNPTARFYSTDTTFNFPEDEIHFYYASSGALSYNWDFGDGTTSDEKNPVHAYSSGGIYDVSLDIVFTDGTAKATRTNYITIISQRGSTYTLSDGGNFESIGDFIAVNVVGTGFERGNSTISGKSGTNSGDFAWVTGLNDETYVNDSEAYLYTPEFDMSIIGDYQLTFFANYSFENLWDGFIVEYTIDRGTSWTKLDEEVRDGWYDALSDANAVFGARVPIFTGSTDGYEQKTSDVSFLGGESAVSFRFTFLTDAAEIDAGLALDDFELIGPIEGEIIPDFKSSLTAGTEGCTGVTYSFTNKSTGSVYDLSWYFGAEASPTQASGAGPHTVEFSSEGSYEVVLTAIDESLNPYTTDTTIIVSTLHKPTITQSGGGATVELTLSEGDAYQWFLDGEVLPNATQQVYSANESGTYSGEVTIGECTILATAVSIVASADSEIVSAYPNPTYDELYLYLKQSVQMIVVSDLSGKVVLQKELNVNQTDVVLSEKWRELEQGLYILTFIKEDELVGSLKVIKK